jgi:hypothetical protein
MAGVHQFALSSQFGDDYTRLACQTPQLQPIAQAFIRNMNRVRGIGVLPINLVSISMINEAARIEALANKGIAFHDPRILFGDPKFDSELFAQVDQERQRLITSRMASDGRSNFEQRIFKAGIYGMNLIIDSNETQSLEAVQATMAAMLIGLWTAFESLAQDTWIAAVNTRPIPLAQRIVQRRSDLGTGNQLKELSWKHIADFGFNLSGSVGTLLLRQRAVDFQSWKTIRAAYKAAFAGELDGIFAPASEELSRLEAVRNLFVHKGGLVDEKFTKRMGNEPGMKEKEGHSLSVNGEYVAHKANVVAVFSTQLIQAVDKWLSENPSDKESRVPS